MNSLFILSVFEFQIDKDVWAVFSTAEWEKFATIFRYFAEDDDFTSNKLGFVATRAAEEKDGRKRFMVTLPSIDFILKNLPLLKNWSFPMTAVKNEFHAPRYLDTCLKIFNINGKII